MEALSSWGRRLPSEKEWITVITQTNFVLTAMTISWRKQVDPNNTTHLLVKNMVKDGSRNHLTFFHISVDQCLWRPLNSQICINLCNEELTHQGSTIISLSMYLSMSSSCWHSLITSCIDIFSHPRECCSSFFLTYCTTAATLFTDGFLTNLNADVTWVTFSFAALASWAVCGCFRNCILLFTSWLGLKLARSMLHVNTSKICSIPENSRMYTGSEEIPRMYLTSLSRLLFPKMQSAATSQSKLSLAFVDKV